MAFTASMGPRPRGRGVGKMHNIQNLDRQASMGPRPRGRGGRAAGTGAGDQPGASMGPRPRGRGVADEQAVRDTLRDALQWGRARAGAELMKRTRRKGTCLSASMGPRPRGRGVHNKWTQTKTSGSLQWGRARAG